MLSSAILTKAAETMPKAAERTLTDKQQAFLTAFLSNGGNAAAAYRAAYPHSANKRTISGMAARLKAHPLIREAIDRASSVSLRVAEQIVDRYEITAERVADELACLAFTRISQLADVRTENIGGKVHQRVTVRDFDQIEPRALAAVCEVKRSAGGELSVKLYDKRAALMDIARLRAYIKDTPPPTGNVVLFKVER